jgi:hypothetical protein
VLAAREHIAATLLDPFHADSAVLFLLDADGMVHELSRYEDVYNGLQEISGVSLRDEHVTLGVFTTGWAAPLSDQTPNGSAPSEHPDRVRVQLCLALDRSFNSVSLVLMENSEEPMVERSGEGPLANAMAATLVTMLRARARRSDDA